MSEDLKKSILRMYELARLEPNPDDLKKYTSQAENIIKYFEKLNELDTSDKNATSHPVENKSLLRQDKAIECEALQELLDQVPEKDNGFVQVPKVI